MSKNQAYCDRSKYEGLLELHEDIDYNDHHRQIIYPTGDVVGLDQFLHDLGITLTDVLIAFGHLRPDFRKASVTIRSGKEGVDLDLTAGGRIEFKRIKGE